MESQQSGEITKYNSDGKLARQDDGITASDVLFGLLHIIKEKCKRKIVGFFETIRHYEQIPGKIRKGLGNATGAAVALLEKDGRKSALKWMRGNSKALANGIGLIGVIGINYAAATGLMNGKTVADISDRYKNYFTPADYAFSIWSLIYIGLLAFVIYQGRSLFNKEKSEGLVQKIGWWFVVSCITNALWIVAWLFDYIGLSVLFMILLFVSLMQIIFHTNMELDQAPPARISFVWWPVSLYSGWITVALIADVAAWLTKIGWEGFGLSEITWAVIMIIAAGIINLVMTWTRNMREFALVGVWALIAIAVENEGESQLIVYTAFATAALLLASSGLHGYENREKNQYLLEEIAPKSND